MAYFLQILAPNMMLALMQVQWEKIVVREVNFRVRTPLNALKKLKGSNHSPRFIQLTKQQTQCKKSNFKVKIGLRVVLATLIITQQTNYLNRSLRQFGGNNKIVSYRRNGVKRKLVS